MSYNTVGKSKNIHHIPPKYPVVLVHGIAAHDRESIIPFWGRIPERLEENGVKVFFGNTDAWGSVQSNAGILYENIEKILSETNCGKVNIIAHSKGGIDSRYLIWKYDYGDKVASLTTISTPHHGAVLSDMIYDQELVHTGTGKKALAIYEELCGDTNPNLLGVSYDLSTVSMYEFNRVIDRDPRVYYHSMYTTMRNALDDVVFYSSYRYIYGLRGPNDGLVSAYSATWGDNVTKIEGGISHTEILDLKRRNVSGIDIPGIYVNIVNGLSERGF